MDALWDGCLVTLSASYEKTLDLLQGGKQKEAAAEFSANFMPAAKKLYTGLPQTYPPRFAKINDWCAWIKNLYILSARTDQALAGADAVAANKNLADIRQHFYDLHNETQTLAANDHVYKLFQAIVTDAPVAAEIKANRDALEKSPLSVKAKTDAEAFTKARTALLEQLDAALKDNAVNAAEAKQLQSAVAEIYRNYGRQLE